MKTNKVLTAFLAIAMLTAGTAASSALFAQTAANAASAPAAQQTAPAAQQAAPAAQQAAPAAQQAAPSLSAAETAVLMGNGINLGNTMEAYGREQLGISADVSKYETIWGQPVTTKEMITGMKQAGFDTLRIPAAWTNMMDYKNGNYTINPALLNRVQTIVDYALEAGMYAIVNDHWDGGWWGMFGQENPAVRDSAMKMYIAMWTQIAQKFKDYPTTLILESANEELGSRLNDAINGNAGTLTEPEQYKATNTINQAFVDTVRKTGGINAERYLLIAGFNTDVAKTCDDRFAMPTDTAKDKLMLSVHYYTPWSYCGGKSQSSWTSESSYKEMNDNFAKLAKFTDAGIPIVLGEYGALKTEEREYKNNTIEYTVNLLANCDLYGIVPMLWDCNEFFDRKALSITNKDLAKLYKDTSYANQKNLTAAQIKTNALAVLDAGLKTGKENDKKNTGVIIAAEGDAVAWLMYSDSSWSGYSAGDKYSPTNKITGLKAKDVKIKRAGTYTVKLDASATPNKKLAGMIFSAVGISNGEQLFPGYIITVKKIKINGKDYPMQGTPYTTSDDGRCTRTNLFNSWITSLPQSARYAAAADKEKLSAKVIDGTQIKAVTTIEVTFHYGPKK